MKPKLIILFIAIAITFSCNKMIFPTKVSGIVIDKTTQEPIEGATVEASYGWGPALSGYRPHEVTTTDAEGKFELKFRAEKPSYRKVEVVDYSVCAWKNPDYPECYKETEWEVPVECYKLYCVDIKEGRKNEVVIEMEVVEYQNY